MRERIKHDNRGIVDRAIEYVSPTWALRREQARQGLEFARMGASSRGVNTRLASSSPVSKSIRNSTHSRRWELAEQRDKARAIYSKNPVGRTLLTTETDNVIADGMKLQAKTESDAFNTEAESRWADWLEVADVRGMLCGSELQRMFYRSPRRDGDGGIILVDRGGQSRLQYVPGDMISNPDGVMSTAGMVDGVEVDSFARPVAFHVRDEDEMGKRQWSRIAASNMVYLAPVLDDDLGVRGDPCYAQIHTYLDGLDGYTDAVVVAARMACVFGLVFKEDNAAKQVSGLRTVQNSQGQDQKAITLENGMLKYVGKDSDVVQVQAQQPMNQTPDFIRVMCRMIGLPFDMPLELVLKDVSQVNFSSARVGLIGYYRACRSRQRAFISRCLSRIYRWWISRERKRAELGLPGSFFNAFPADLWPHSFSPVGWDYTDPVSEAQADLLQIDMGIKTQRMACEERGRDWEEIQEQRAAERMARKLAELPDVASQMTRDRIEVAGQVEDPAAEDVATQEDAPDAPEAPDDSTTEDNNEQ